MTTAKQILITGANDGIGLALAKQLTKDYGVKVFLGSRDATKGSKAVEDVISYNDGDKSLVELVLIDVNSKDTITAAVERLQRKGVKLYALVNNAGIFDDELNPINTNYYGTKRVTEAFLPLLENDGRIVMTGSGAGPMTVQNMPSDLQKKFVFPDTPIMEELESMMEVGSLKDYEDKFCGSYGTSKAMMHMYSSVLAKEYPQYNSYSTSPGFIRTKLSAKFGATTPVEEGTKSLVYCLFEATKEQSGWYFGSDSKRSPVHATRDPGDPEFDGVYPFGEDNNNTQGDEEEGGGGAEPTFTARCLCGTCTLTVTGMPVYYGNCNCSWCRFQTGAAFCAWAAFPKNKVSGPDLIWTNATTISKFTATKNGTRSFCKTCGTTWMYESNIMDVASIPAALFTKGACHGDQEENSMIPFGDPAMYFSLESKCIKEVLPFPSDDKRKQDIEKAFEEKKEELEAETN